MPSSSTPARRLAYMFRGEAKPPGRRRSRWKANTHFGLLLYLTVLVTGSAVWIHYIFRGDMVGDGAMRLNRPAWASGGRGDNRAHGMNLTLSPSFETCGFAEDSFAGTCGPREARLRVHAKIKTDPGVSENREGLHLVLLASGDFREWWPANAGGLMQPREQFSFKPAEVTDEHRTRLQTVFSAQELRSVEDINTAIERPPPGRLTATELAPLLPPLFLGTGAIEIDEDVALETLRKASSSRDCQTLSATGTCKGGRCVGTATECDQIVEEQRCSAQGSGSQGSGGSCSWVNCTGHDTAATCAAHGGCKWVQNPSCSVDNDEFIEAYRQLRERWQPSHEVSTYACVGTPGFAYIAGCVTAGFPRSSEMRTCATPPCPGIRGPPFTDCRALHIACGPTCHSGAGEDQTRWQRDDVLSPLRHCDLGSRAVHQHYMDEMTRTGHDPVAVVFAIVYVIGLCSMFQMYMPGVGQRQGQRPTWDKMRGAILRGQLDTFSESHQVKNKHQADRRLWHRLAGWGDAAVQQPSDRTSPMSRVSEWGNAAKQTMKRMGTSMSPTRQTLITKSDRHFSESVDDEPAAMIELGSADASAGKERPSASLDVDVPGESEGEEDSPVSPELSRASGAREGSLDSPEVVSYANKQDLEQADLAMFSTKTMASARFRGDASDLRDEHTDESTLLMQHLKDLSGSRGMDNSKTWDAEDTNGQTTVSFSISASEGRNIILRNLMGKVAANLALRMSVWKNHDEPPATPIQIIDGFADEGHRIGAYYLMRAISITFYLALPPPVALKLASEWIKKMNAHQSAENVDIFDEGKDMPEEWGLGKKKFDVFELLSEHDQRRSEIQFIQFFHHMFPALNSFTLPVDFLFNQVLTMPVLGSKAEAALFTTVHSLLKACGGDHQALVANDKAITELLEAIGATDRRVLLDHLLPAVFLGLQRAEGSLEAALAAAKSTPLTMHCLWIDYDEAKALPNTIAHKETALRASIQEAQSSNEGGGSTNRRGLVAKQSSSVKGLSQSTVGSRVQQFESGTTVGSIMLGTFTPYVPKAAPAAMSHQNHYSLPSSKLREDADDATALIKDCGERSTKLDADRGVCNAEPRSRQAKESNQLPFTFFNPEVVSLFGSVLFGLGKGSIKLSGDRRIPQTAAAYITSVKELVKGKADPISSDAYYDLAPMLEASSKLALLDATQLRYYAFDHVVTTAAVEARGHPVIRAVYLARGRPDKWQPWTKADHRRKVKPGVWVCKKPQNNSHEAWWRARRKVGLLESMVPGENRVRVFWYHAPGDDPSVRCMQAEEAYSESSQEESLSTLQVLNMHLGKAGGLNFGLEGLLRLGVVPPSETFPMMFGIIDARHSCDGRFWTRVLPAFYFLEGDADEKVSFDPDICLCQLPHSYIGTTSDKDKLDMRNNFLFSGMAIIRDRSYGMTSCGTGGIWAITSPIGAGSYFYGRTMIEDTSSTHLRFFEGKRSVYLPPKRGTDDQIMRAVPKVSANYLEALERWDTGAIQILLSMSVTYGRFWLALLFLAILCSAVVLPMFMEYTVGDLYYTVMGQKYRIPPVVTQVRGARYYLDTIFFFYSFGVFVLTFGTVAILSLTDGRRLNNLLRYLVVTFNSIYPFNALTTLFWLALPPWLCFTAKFPFALSAFPAVFGSLALQLVQFFMVAKMKKDAEVQGAELNETSIFRSQQLDLVTVPIKLRAIAKGFSTAWYDIFHHHDNSWWESFGAGHSKSWVQTWLIFVFSAMTLSIIVGPTRLILAYVNNDGFMDYLMPVGFGVTKALINMWVLSSPLWYIVKDRKERPESSLRYINLAVLVIVAIIVGIMVFPPLIPVDIN